MKNAYVSDLYRKAGFTKLFYDLEIYWEILLKKNLLIAPIISWGNAKVIVTMGRLVVMVPQDSSFTSTRTLT